jgi:hypothetical protein
MRGRAEAAVTITTRVLPDEIGLLSWLPAPLGVLCWVNGEEGLVAWGEGRPVHGPGTSPVRTGKAVVDGLHRPRSGACRAGRSRQRARSVRRHGIRR